MLIIFGQMSGDKPLISALKPYSLLKCNDYEMVYDARVIPKPIRQGCLKVNMCLVDEKREIV